MSRIRRILQVCVVAVYAVVLFPATSPAPGNDVGANVGGLLKHYAGELYGGTTGMPLTDAVEAFVTLLGGAISDEDQNSQDA
jgi:hypothetical protein